MSAESQKYQTKILQFTIIFVSTDKTFPVLTDLMVLQSNTFDPPLTYCVKFIKTNSAR